MKITLQIQRFNPEEDAQPYPQRYDLEVEPTDRVLDALMWIKDQLDGTLAFRRSCAHGVCGSDGMIINGQERLACKTLVQDVAEEDGATVTVEPLKHLPLLRDLIVGQDEFFDRWNSKAYDASFWREDCAEVFTHIVNDASLQYYLYFSYVKWIGLAFRLVLKIT